MHSVLQHGFPSKALDHFLVVTSRFIVFITWCLWRCVLDCGIKCVLQSPFLNLFLWPRCTWHSWKRHLKHLSEWNKAWHQKLSKSPLSWYWLCSLVAQRGHGSIYNLHEILSFKFESWRIVICVISTRWLRSEVALWLELGLLLLEIGTVANH